MEKPKVNRTHQYIGYAIIVSVVILATLIFFLVREYRAIRRAQIVNARESWFSAVIKNHGPMTANDVGLIRPWMTFDYVNRLFKVPPDYLKTRLNISNTRYPQLSISGYAKYNHLDITAFMSEVTGALHDYLTGAVN